MNDVKRVTVQYRVDVDKLPGEATRLLGVAREKTKELHTYLSKVDLNNTKSCTGFLSEEGKDAYARLEIISDAILDCQTLMKGYHDLVFGQNGGRSPTEHSDLDPEQQEKLMELNKQLEGLKDKLEER